METDLELEDLNTRKVQLAQPGNNPFMKTFWRTIIALFVITCIMIVLGVINHSDKALKEAAKERFLSGDSLRKISSVLGTVYKDIDTLAYPKSFQDDVSRQVDEAFLPVYQNIPKFTDVHYSVIGEYTEMGLAATGDLASHIQEQLFNGFNDEKLSSEISNLIPNTLQKMMKELSRDAIQKNSIPLEEQQLFEQAIEQYLQKHMTNFRTTMMLGGGAFGIVVGAASVKLMATAIARKLLVKLGIKLAAKLALKSGGAAGIAAVGAAIGSVVPGVGTAIGAVTGAVVGWFTVDAAVVSVDEWLNRDEFEADLRMEVTQQKEKMKRNIIQYANDVKRQLSIFGKDAIAGKAPVNL